MPRPAKTWIEDLPRDRLLAEYSMWSADLIAIGDDLKRIDGFADILHIDVADGHFALVALTRRPRLANPAGGAALVVVAEHRRKRRRRRCFCCCS